MVFNYGREKRRFDKEWEQLQKEYAAAGMEEGDIAQMKEYDWEWFCSRRTYENHNQKLPDVGDIEAGNTILFQKFPALSVDFNSSNFQTGMRGYRKSRMKSCTSGCANWEKGI